MKQGVNYDKSMGFKLDSATDLQAAVRTLRSATGEEVELTLRCFVCGKEACPGCPYSSPATGRRSPRCASAPTTRPEKSVYETYTKTFDVALRA